MNIDRSDHRVAIMKLVRKAYKALNAADTAEINRCYTQLVDAWSTYSLLTLLHSGADGACFMTLAREIRSALTALTTYYNTTPTR